MPAQVTFKRKGIFNWQAWCYDDETQRWVPLPASTAILMVIRGEAEDVGYIPDAVLPDDEAYA